MTHSTPEATFISMVRPATAGIRLAVKDNIDVAGILTTAGCPLLARSAVLPRLDAPCVARLRRGGASVVGKTNLVELALGTHGINPWFGTPRNPLGPDLAPGGSSSGSAVAVATGAADVALGTDTGGSIRIPAACCGVVGLKPTFGRVPLDGVVPLAPSLDTVGPLAQTVRAVSSAMALLDPGFAPSAEVPAAVALFCDQAAPVVASAIRQAILDAGFQVHDEHISMWSRAHQAGSLLLVAEAAAAHPSLLRVAGELDPMVAARLRSGAAATPAACEEATRTRTQWTAALGAVLHRCPILVTPTLPSLPPTLDAAPGARLNQFTLPVNLAGLPALALPVPMGGGLPASMQLIGPMGSEPLLVAAALRLEASMT